MPIVLKCPICGRDVISRQLKLLVAASMRNESQAETVVCHCPDSHRFVASLKQVEREAGVDEHAEAGAVAVAKDDGNQNETALPHTRYACYGN